MYLHLDNSIGYKSLHQINSNYGNAQVYQSKSINQNTFNHIEKLSISLYNKIASYGDPRELHREIVRFVNPIIRDKEKLGTVLVLKIIILPFH